MPYFQNCDIEWTALRLQSSPKALSPWAQDLPFSLGLRVHSLSYTTGVPVFSILKTRACAWLWIHWSGVLTHDLTPQLDFRLLPSWQTHLLGCAWPPLPSWDLILICRLPNLTCLPSHALPMTCTPGWTWPPPLACPSPGLGQWAWLARCCPADFQLLTSKPSLCPNTALTAMKQLINVKKIVLILGLYTFFKNQIFEGEYRDPALTTHVRAAKSRGILQSSSHSSASA